MRIGVDVMGGDHAPGEILKGAFAALEQLDADDRIALAGDRDLIAEAIAERGIDDPRIEIIGTTEVIEMAAPPVDSVRQRPDSSIVVLARMSGPKEAKLDGWLSAGNTGACVTASQFHMKRLPGVHRPGIAVTVPTFAGPIVLLDVGANIAPKPHHLAQYGVMGRVFSQKVLGVENPRVALMNVGGEEQKGTTEMKRARDLLRSSRDTNFIGYVEGRGVFNGEADVVITDGVVGNVMLKLAEGEAKVTLFATGSEVSIAMEARALLAADGIGASVVSMPCWELFDQQDDAWRASVLGAGTVRVAVEAGVKFGWERYIGLDGGFVGMNSFGASAPAPDLYEHFGITARHVADEARSRL